MPFLGRQRCGWHYTASRWCIPDPALAAAAAAACSGWRWSDAFPRRQNAEAKPRKKNPGGAHVVFGSLLLGEAHLSKAGSWRLGAHGVLFLWSQPSPIYMGSYRTRLPRSLHRRFLPFLQYTGPENTRRWSQTVLSLCTAPWFMTCERMVGCSGRWRSVTVTAVWAGGHATVTPTIRPLWYIART